MRGMERAVLSSAIFLGALVGASSGAMAAAGMITTTVAPLSNNVTYSKDATSKAPALNTYIGYAVAMSNTSGNTINNVTFQGTVYTTATDEQIAFGSSDGATCNTVSAPVDPDHPNAITIQCAIGQFTNGASVSFAVFFKAPIIGDSSPPPGTDLVSFSGVAITAEGFNGGNSWPNSIDAWGPAEQVTLGTSNPTNVKSAVQKSGGSLFTGEGVSLSSDPFTTTVTVPPEATYTTATINETTLPACGAGNFVVCWSSELTIPGTFSPYLAIVLREDASNIIKGTKIGSVVIKYTYTDEQNVEKTVIVQDCASPTTPRSDGLPCIASRTYYKTKNVPGWTPDLDGDFEWTIITAKNGKYDVL
jgi:hypothetical protein